MELSETLWKFVQFKIILDDLYNFIQSLKILHELEQIFKFFWELKKDFTIFQDFLANCATFKENPNPTSCTSPKNDTRRPSNQDFDLGVRAENTNSILIALNLNKSGAFTPEGISDPDSLPIHHFCFRTVRKSCCVQETFHAFDK